MNELVALAAKIQSLMELRGWEFCFIGGMAVQAWSELFILEQLRPLAELKKTPETLDQLEAIRRRYSLF